MTTEILTFEMPDYLSSEILFRAYCSGYFPMFNQYTHQLEWHNPNPRAIFPLGKIKLSKSLQKTMKKEIFSYKIDGNFLEVISRCADREDCWISDEFIEAYTQFHHEGFAHSIEAYFEGELVGGLYGIAIGSAFFGESMFSTMTDASKCAFAYLAEMLHSQNFLLLDSQYINPHTERLGAYEIPKNEYLQELFSALTAGWRFPTPEPQRYKEYFA